MTSLSYSPTESWLLATRPKSLPAAASPVLIGTALAYSHGAFSPLAATLALLGALLLQIGANLANDYQDFEKGSDRPDRLGPIRVTQSGLLPVQQVKHATILAFFAATVAGSYLMWIAGWPIILLGILSIIAAYAYTGGPYPLGYHGLGDLFVFIFFGIGAVCGTYYVQALSLSPEALLAAVSPGLLSIAILVTNNHRDYYQDIVSGKKTLAVRFGLKASRAQFYACVLAPYLLLIPHAWFFRHSPWMLLPAASLPVAINLIRHFDNAEGRVYNDVLAKTGQLLFLFSILMSLALILSRQPMPL